MDAIKFLTQQHRQLDALFDEFENASDGAKKKKLELSRKVSDLLAVHAAVEEKIFYPAAKSARTEEMLREAVEEHLSVKRIIADLVELQEIDDEAEAKMSVLREQKKHHVEEEEKELFPKARKLLGADRLRELGEEMEELAQELVDAGEPRLHVPDETERAAPIRKRGRRSYPGGTARTQIIVVVKYETGERSGPSMRGPVPRHTWRHPPGGGGGGAVPSYCFTNRVSSGPGAIWGGAGADRDRRAARAQTGSSEPWSQAMTGSARAASARTISSAARSLGVGRWWPNTPGGESRSGAASIAASAASAGTRRRSHPRARPRRRGGREDRPDRGRAGRDVRAPRLRHDRRGRDGRGEQERGAGEVRDALLERGVRPRREEREDRRDRDEVAGLAPPVERADAQEGEEHPERRDRAEQEAPRARRPRGGRAPRPRARGGAAAAAGPRRGLVEEALEQLAAPRAAARPRRGRGCRGRTRAGPGGARCRARRTRRTARTRGAPGRGGGARARSASVHAATRSGASGRAIAPNASPAAASQGRSSRNPQHATARPAARRSSVIVEEAWPKKSYCATRKSPASQAGRSPAARAASIVAARAIAAGIALTSRAATIPNRAAPA